MPSSSEARKPLFLNSTLFLLVACALTGALAAQQRFRSTTSLLTLDVSVLDLDGKPVTDLAPGDFVVTLNKEQQPVRALVFLATHTAKETATQAPPAGASLAATPPASMPSGSEPDPKLIVVLVDDESIHPLDSKGLFVAAERFVDRISSRDWIGLASTSGRLNVNPSRDRAPLLAKLRRASGWMNDPRRERKPPVGFMQAQEADLGSQGALRSIFETSCGIPAGILAKKNLAEILVQFDCAADVQRLARDNAAFARVNVRNQLDTYVAVIKAMAAAPGVKQLVILTGGVPLAPADSRDFVSVAEAAAAAGVQITILMEEPDETDMSNPAARVVAKDQRAVMQQTQTLAEISGGQFFRVIGQADRFYDRVLTSASAIYRIGVDLPPGVPPDGNYKVMVTVNRPRVKVLASRYAVPPQTEVATTAEGQTKRAIETGTPLYGIQILMSAEVLPATAGSPAAIRVSIDVPGDTSGPVTGFFGVVGPDKVLKGGRRDPVRSADARTYHLEVLLPAASGTYDLRFAAIDAHGAVGATTQKIVVK
ncbi:MAG TPA: VWA domain-containing protein [Vicinamibacterales bacterium]|nr:VWA domain-containing protein [Vicinamibacterales bacterium]